MNKLTFKIRNVIRDKHTTNTCTSRYPQYLPIYIVICNSYLRKNSFLILCPKIGTVEYRAETNSYIIQAILQASICGMDEPVIQGGRLYGGETLLYRKFKKK